MTANNNLTSEVVRNYCDQDTVSRGLQRKLEGLLAGFSIIHPLEVLEVFPRVVQIMENELALEWLRNLSDRHHELFTLENDETTIFITQMISDFDEGRYKKKILNWMNDTFLAYDPVLIEGDRVNWRGYDPKTISVDLVYRIISQHYLRAGLCDLVDYVLEVLER